MCLYIHDEGNFLKQVHPELDLKKPLECKKKLIGLQADLGLDLFVKLLHGIYPDWIVYGGVNTEGEGESWEVSTEETRLGASLVKRSIVRTPDGALEQSFTVSESVDAPGTVWYACTRKPVKTEKDLDIVMRYEPSVGSDFPGRVKALVTAVKSELGDRGVLAVWVP